MRKRYSVTDALFVAAAGATLNLAIANAQPAANCEARREEMMGRLHDAAWQWSMHSQEYQESLMNIERAYHLCRTNHSVAEMAASGNIEKIRELIKAGADVNEKNSNGSTALMIAAGTGNIDMIKVLIDAKADVNAKSNDGFTALMGAIRSAQLDAVKYLNAVKYLIEAKADVNAKTSDGYTALMFASSDIYPDLVATLLQAGADVKAKNNAGETALTLAIDSRRTINVDLLKSAGAQ